MLVPNYPSKQPTSLLCGVLTRKTTTSKKICRQQVVLALTRAFKKKPIHTKHYKSVLAPS